MALSDLLNKEIEKTLSPDQKRFYGLDEEVGADMRSATGDFSIKALQIIQSTLINADTISIDELQLRIQRLKKLQAYTTQSQIGAQEETIVLNTITKVLNALQDQLSAKKSIFRRVQGLISQSTIDIGALLIGMSANDPLMALGVKVVGDMLARKRERKAEQLERSRQTIREDAESLRPQDILPAGPYTEPLVSPDFPNVSDTIAPQNGTTNLKGILEDIFLFTEEISDDVKKLVDYAEKREYRETQSSLQDIENLREASRDRPGLTLDQPTKTSTGSRMGDAINNITRKIFGGLKLPAWLLGITAGLGVAAKIGGGLAWMAINGVLGYFKAEEWGTSKIASALGGVLGGPFESKILNVLSSMGAWALLGAKVGSVVPGIGTIIGGIVGALLGGILGYFGGERIAKFIDEIGYFLADFGHFLADKISHSFLLVQNAFVSVWDSTINKILDISDSIKISLLGWVADLATSIATRLGSYAPQFMEDMIKGVSNERISIIKRGAQRRKRAEKAKQMRQKDFIQDQQQLLQTQQTRQENRLARRESARQKSTTKQSPNMATQLERDVSPTPSGTATGSLDGIDYVAYANAVGKRESGNNYQAVNTIGFLGKYQFGAMALEDAGLVRPGVGKKGNAALNDPKNWTIEGGKDTFLNTPEIQENAMFEYTKRNLKTLKNIGVVSPTSSANFTAGALMAAHLKGPGGAKDLLIKGSDNRDAYGTKASEYFALGKESQNQSSTMALLNSPPAPIANTIATNLQTAEKELTNLLTSTVRPTIVAPTNQTIVNNQQSTGGAPYGTIGTSSLGSSAAKVMGATV